MSNCFDAITTLAAESAQMLQLNGAALDALRRNVSTSYLHQRQTNHGWVLLNSLDYNPDRWMTVPDEVLECMIPRFTQIVCAIYNTNNRAELT